MRTIALQAIHRVTVFKFLVTMESQYLFIILNSLNPSPQKKISTFIHMVANYLSLATWDY